MKSNISLGELVDQSELSIFLKKDHLFLLQAYILSEAKEVKSSVFFRKEIADPKKLKKFGDVSSGFVNELVRKLRQHLALASVNFVRESAHFLKNDFLIRMVSEEFTIKHNTCWPCTPMFWTYKSLLQFAQKEKIPIVMHVKFQTAEAASQVVDDDYLFFGVPSDASSYSSLLPSQLHLEEVACIIQGVVCISNSEPFLKSKWRSMINEHSILDIILAGASDHRQYPDPTQEYLIEGLHNKEFETYKILAKSKGFSSENPSSFFIQHVYTSKAANVYRFPENLLDVE